MKPQTTLGSGCYHYSLFITDEPETLYNLIRISHSNSGLEPRQIGIDVYLLTQTLQGLLLSVCYTKYSTLLFWLLKLLIVCCCQAFHENYSFKIHTL